MIGESDRWKPACTGHEHARLIKKSPPVENLTGKADTAKQILKSRVAAQRIVDGVYLESS